MSGLQPERRSGQREPCCASVPRVRLPRLARAGYCAAMVMWASDTRGARVREGLTLLLSQGVIDDFEIRHEDEHPYRVTLPAGVVPLDEHQAAHFVLGAVSARFGPLSRESPQA